MRVHYFCLVSILYISIVFSHFNLKAINTKIQGHVQNNQPNSDVMTSDTYATSITQKAQGSLIMT